MNWKAVVVGIIAGVIAMVALQNCHAGMMGGLAEGVPAVYYPNPQTYSIWSEKGMSLYMGLSRISITTRNGVSGLHFVDQGVPKVLNLRPGEGVIISADPTIPGGPKFPQAPFQQRVGPRK